MKFAKALLSRLCYRSFKMGSCKRKRRNGISDQRTLGEKKMLHFAFDTVPTLKAPRCPDIKKPIWIRLTLWFLNRSHHCNSPLYPGTDGHEECHVALVLYKCYKCYIRSFDISDWASVEHAAVPEGFTRVLCRAPSELPGGGWCSLKMQIPWCNPQTYRIRISPTPGSGAWKSAFSASSQELPTHDEV